MRPTRLSRALLGAAGALALAAALVTVGSGPGVAAGTCTPTTATPTVTLTNHSVALGSVLRFTGTGWCHPTDGGSRIAVKLDLGAYSRLDTAVHSNRSVWAVVDASATDGTFSARLTLPDGTAATSTPAFTLGTHSLQLLSGSLKPGDTVRTLASADLTVVAPGVVVPEEPTWPHATVTAGGATAWVERELPAGDGRTMRIAGYGWKRPSGAGSAIAIKLNRSAKGAQYVRSGAEVIEGDATIWALLRPGDGTFDTTLDLPPGLTAGQYLTVSLATGKFAAGDTQRSLTTAPLVVGGRPWVDEEDDEEPRCTPTSTRPTVRLATTSVAFGGSLRLTGTGWCNPAGGGSRIGVKIDDGGYSHLDDTRHANRTIWAIIEAADADGTFAADIELPDGTAATSSPRLPRGEHTLRLLSGTLAPGDTVRTLESEPFVVGSYRPNGTPDPLDATRDLRAGNRHGATATVSSKRLRLTLPQAAVGTWTFVSVYSPDGSPRYPWGRWLRLGAGHRLDLSLRSAGLTGPGRVVAQSGEPGHVGEVLGWVPARFGTVPSDPDEPAPSTPPGAAAPPGGTVAAPAAPPAAVPPSTVPTAPAPPYGAFTDLDPTKHRSITGRFDDGILTVRIGTAEPGDAVYLYVYTPDQVTPAGWATVDDDRHVRLDLSAFGSGYAGVTVQDAGGRLLGWTPVAFGAAEAAVDTAEATSVTPPAQVVTVPVAARSWLGPTDGLLLATGALVLAAASLVTSRRRPTVVGP